jgi:hypothetical protein
MRREGRGNAGRTGRPEHAGPFGFLAHFEVNVSQDLVKKPLSDRRNRKGT